MHTKPDLRVLLKWMIAHSGSVITDVIPLDYTLPMPEESKTPLPRFGLRALLVFTIIFGALVGLDAILDSTPVSSGLTLCMAVRLAGQTGTARCRFF